jgi:putative DNA primase/helicase
MANSVDDVLQQMLERGMELPPKQLVPDGKKVTWAGDARRPNKKNAWCVLHEWASPKTHKTFVVGRYGIRDENWQVEPTQTEWSPAEKTAWLERRKQLEKEAADDRQSVSAECRTKADKIWQRAPTEGASEYLQRKKVGAYGVRFAFGKVLVPVSDLADVLHGLQWIAADGGKVFGTGTVKEGHFHLIGAVSDTLPVLFAEGYASGASVYMASSWPTVVCFDAGNILPVMAAWRKLYPEHKFIVAADDDRHLVRRLCERLQSAGVGAKQGDFAKSAGGLRDMRWELPDGRVVDLKARYAKDRADVWHIEGSLTADGVTHILKIENAGRAKGFAAARRHDARVLLPRFADRADVGTDFNDLHVGEGLEVVRTQLLAEPEEKATRKNAPPPGEGGPNAASRGGGGLHFPYLTDKWEVKGIRENVYYALREDAVLCDLVRYNDFSQRIDKARPAPWGGEPGPWLPMDDLRLANYLGASHGLLVGNPITIEQAVMMAAQDSRYNPVRDDMEAVEWDGIPRVRHWMVDCLGAEESDYVAAASQYFLISLVARVFEPGCQMDYMLVLQGGQGEGKSSVLQVLGGGYYAGGSFRIGDKDSLQALQGRLIFNFNELDALSRVENSAIKGFITERTDHFRPPYAKSFQGFPRNCVLTGDTNQGEFLRDATGDRRFWVVHVSAINLDRMVEWRAQLMAEAVHLYKAGARRFPDREEEKRLFFPEQDKWKFIDVWHDALSKYVNSGEHADGYDGCLSDSGGPLVNDEREFFSTHELLVKALHIDVGKIDRAGTMQKSVGNAMKLLGFESYKWPKGRNRPRGYRRVFEVVAAPVASTPAPKPPAPPTAAMASAQRDPAPVSTVRESAEMIDGVPSWD